MAGQPGQLVKGSKQVENMVGTSVRVPRVILERLDRQAALTRWTKGELHRQALEMYLALLEAGQCLAPLQRLPDHLAFHPDAELYEQMKDIQANEEGGDES